MIVDSLIEERGDWLLTRTGATIAPASIEQMESVGSEVVLCQEAMLIKPEVIEAIGPLEAQLPPSWRQADFLFRARRAGFSTAVMPPAELPPRLSSETDAEVYLWWRGYLLFMERNLSRREWLRSWLKSLAPDLVKLVGRALIERRQRRILLASLRGVWHHLIRRFSP